MKSYTGQLQSNLLIILATGHHYQGLALILKIKRNIWCNQYTNPSLGNKMQLINNLEATV